MITPVIHYAAVLVAALAAMVIGAIWYSVFAKVWMESLKISPADMERKKKECNMHASYALQFLGAIVMSYVLAHFVDYAGATTAGGGATAGFWLWLGFMATAALACVAWEGRSWKWYAINVGNSLLTLLVMGAILAAWR